MSKIREKAKAVGHEVVGKLTRHPEYETTLDHMTGKEVRMKGQRFYLDEGGNEYWVSKRGVCIVTADGGVI